VLDRRHRLTTSAGFTTTTRRGRRAGTRLLVVHAFCPEPDSPMPEAAPRVGFVVGRSVGGAVVRNRVKRRLRHLVRDRLPSLPEATSIVVRALPDAAHAGYADLARDLDTALGRSLSPRPRARRQPRQREEAR
jgi:ribonuclease P protein component